MLMFWVLAAFMILMALVVVARVFLKGQQSRESNINSVSLAIYEKRLAEQERDRKSGVLTQQQAAAEKLELEKTLLEEININVASAVDETPSAAGTRNNWLTAVIIMLVIPVVSIFVYYQLGSPELIDGQSVAAQAMAGEHGELKIEDMVARLALKMEQNPDDPQGWRMLARSYMTLGRYPDAVNATERLYKLTGDEVDVLLQYADALAMANNSTMAGKPEELVHKALALDPENITGLWLAGMAQSELGNFRSAIDYWQRVLPKLNDEADKSSINNLINSARKQLGEALTEQPVMMAAAPAPVTAPAADQPMISVKISLNPEFSGRVSPDSALFVTAQEAAGPPMPIAVIRKQAGDLPLEIILDDSKAMIPTRKLSNFEKVKIGARISMTGNAIPQAGDLTAEPVIVDTGQRETVSLEIDREVQ